ncbi:MAG: hypothetical protein DSZ05_01150 [Sulfurospirillum sp.]|nr:MAG: hypothetical protein DSZ05_01150 [Sulfurospirillum sp.]
MIDVIIVGAGIAGASTAFALQKRDMRVLVLEKDSVCSGSSAAAGAFLSPKISKPSAYKNYLNSALAYSLAFYERYFPDLLYKKGLYKLPLDSEDSQRCNSYEPYIDFPWEKRGEGYFFPEAGLILPDKLCRELLKEVTLKEFYEVSKIVHDGNVWYVNDTFSAKYLILATGDTPEPISLPSLKSKKIGGYRYDVTFREMREHRHNTHKDISVSLFLKEHIIVGATHIRGDIALEKAAEQDTFHLLEKAKRFTPMTSVKILQHYTGYRRFSFDYFPFAGVPVDERATLTKYPYIRTGAKVPEKQYIYHPNLYIHTALGSRGFVFAPYNAKMLADAICDAIPIQRELLPALRFRKWARKQR